MFTSASPYWARIPTAAAASRDYGRPIHLDTGARDFRCMKIAAASSGLALGKTDRRTHRIRETFTLDTRYLAEQLPGNFPEIDPRPASGQGAFRHGLSVRRR
jgi:hypothetical protein